MLILNFRCLTFIHYIIVLVYKNQTFVNTRCSVSSSLILCFNILFFTFNLLYFTAINIKSPIANNIHTIFINYDREEVKNLTELPVIDDQIYARSLIKSFTAAAGFARQKFGTNVKKLPEPVVVQCVQSDGQNFHFSVYQLNTLDLDNENVRNFWWSEPFIKLYELADYEDARPCLRGYNSEVFKKFLAFYQYK